MSYYPTERRGGCMESISRCCRQAYVYPLDTRKLLCAAGGVVGIILVAVIWTGISSHNPDPQTRKGSDVLLEAPLIVGCNFFPSNLRDLVHNNVSAVNFGGNLQTDPVFGNDSCTSCQTDLKRLQHGDVSTQIWSISVPCDSMEKDAVSLTLEQLDAVNRLISAYPKELSLLTTSSGLSSVFNTARIGSVLSVTSGHSIDGRLAVLRTLYQLGVRTMAIASDCAERSNSWSSTYSASNDTGLTDFGKVIVKEMNRMGMVVDLSGSSHQTQLDILNVSRAPVIFSHTAAYSICNNSRNIQDDVLRKLAINGGVAMVTFAQSFLSSSNNVTINNVIEHINYIKNITGPEGVGIGAEFDAKNQKYPSELSDVSKFPTLFDNLIHSNWTWDELKMLSGGNLLRILQQVEQNATSLSTEAVDETYNLPNASDCYSDYSSRNTTALNTTAEVTTKIPTVTASAITVTPDNSTSINTTPKAGITSPTAAANITTASHLRKIKLL